eukprot:GFYU01004859.1.p1 GENE.GFYU01004859.1~~GFYU01004859.1.p1  ORF type:complete len:205 (-),score=64.19 GFYU01004859.1:296-910(-)
MFMFLLFFVLAAVVGFLFWMGALTPVKTRGESLPDLIFAYKYNVGSYDKDVAPEIAEAGKIFDETDYELRKDRCIAGIYYDDPKKVDKGQCRFAVGGVLTNEDYGLRTAFEKAGYKVVELPASRCVTTDFVFREKFATVSILLAIMKTYPPLFKAAQDVMGNGTPGPLMELYTKDRMYYYIILENMEKFVMQEYYQPPPTGGEI